MQSSSSAVERFSALTAIPECRHAFIGRIPGIEVSHDKAEVLARLDAAHREIRTSLSMDRGPLLTVQQVHGDRIAVIDQPATSDECFSGSDGLITNQPQACLGIYVADCCAVFSSIQFAAALAWSIPVRKELNLESLPARLRKWGRRLDPYRQTWSCS